MSKLEIISKTMPVVVNSPLAAGQTWRNNQQNNSNNEQNRVNNNQGIVQIQSHDSYLLSDKLTTQNNTAITEPYNNLAMSNLSSAPGSTTEANTTSATSEAISDSFSNLASDKRNISASTITYIGKSFDVNILTPTALDIKFNWWVVSTQ